MDLETLKAKLRELQAKEQQALANFQACAGARQFCEQLISEIEEEMSKQQIEL